jgi:PAS domain S-box-containing protein
MSKTNLFTKSARSGEHVRGGFAAVERIGRERTFAGETEPLKTPSSTKDESVERYRDFFSIAPIGFYILDRQGRICELNEKGASLMSFPLNWLVGKAFVVFVARQDVSRFLEFLSDSTVRSPRSIKCEMCVEGRNLPVRISAATFKEESATFHKLAVVDLSDSEDTQKLLNRSVSDWHCLVRNAADTIMTVEQSGRVSFVNRPTWGYSVSGLVGTNILDYVPESSQSRMRRCLEQSFKVNKQSVCEVNGVAGRSNVWYSFSFGSPHPFARIRKGRLTTVIIREISEQKRMEAALRMSSEQMRNFATRLEAVREEERTRVAREIHDELGQALTVLKLDLSWLQSKNADAAVMRKKMKSMITQVDNTIDSVRRISSQLRPPILDDLGLIPAIEWHVKDFRKRTGIRTKIVSNVEDLDLTLESSAVIYRVLQEALTNIVRHAKASRVWVRLNLTGGLLRIVIEDNGLGMIETKHLESKSLGIIGMKERISRLGGDFNISSEPGAGTRLDVLIPTNHD